MAIINRVSFEDNNIDKSVVVDIGTEAKNIKNLTLNTISDVNISNLKDGQSLKYNRVSGYWENNDGGDIPPATPTNNGLMSAEDKSKLDTVETGAEVNKVNSVNSKAGDVTLNAEDLNAIPIDLKGAVNGVAELDANGKVPSSQLPAGVDDIIECSSISEFPITGQTGKIYVALDTNLTYRWGGSSYVEISPSLALGETSSTAFRGDRGQEAYNHAINNKGSAFSNGFYKITTNGEGHVTAATPVTKADITALGNPDAVTCSNKTIRFGIDSQGRYGYIKDGADTVIPFKTPSGEAQLEEIIENGTYHFNIEDYATAVVEVNVAPKLQSKTASALVGRTNTITPDSGYDGLSQVSINRITNNGRMEITIDKETSTINSNGIYTIGTGTIEASSPTGYYEGYKITKKGISLTVQVPTSTPNLQTKSITITPDANWSSATTGATAITADSGYDGLQQVNVSTPMIRDNTLLTASTVSTPSTVYNGDTSQSNTKKLLRVAPTKDGMAYTGSYLYIQPNSYLGNATAGDVRSGKTFSSSAGIQETGTWSPTEPSGDKALGTITTNGSKSYTISGYATCSFTVNVPTQSANLQSKSTNLSPTVSSYSSDYTSYTTISPDTGYDGMSQVQVRTPLVRDYTILNATGVVTPSTIYNGTTAQSNSAKVLNVRPTKSGWVTTSSDIVVPASSAMGNATAADVISGKTFSSVNGIQLTGTGSTGTTKKIKYYYTELSTAVASKSKASATFSTSSTWYNHYSNLKYLVVFVKYTNSFTYIFPYMNTALYEISAIYSFGGTDSTVYTESNPRTQIKISSLSNTAIEFNNTHTAKATIKGVVMICLEDE